MIRFNYYFIDVDRNYCEITQKGFVFSLVAAIRDGNKTQLLLAKEFVLHNFKKRAPMFTLEEFKVVYVNRFKKLEMSSILEEIEDSTRYDPIISTSKYDVHIVKPGQRLTVRCKVVKNEVEYRSIAYKDLQ